MTEDTGNDLPAAEASKDVDSSDNACSSEPPTEDSANLGLPSTSEGPSENDVTEGRTREVTTERTSESAASNEEEVASIPEDVTKEENKLPSHSQKEADVDDNNKELDSSEGNLNVDTSETLDTVGLDSTPSVTQETIIIGNDTEVKNDSNESEDSPVVDNQAIDENQTVADVSSKTSDAKKAGPAVSHQIPQASHGMAETVTENSKLRTSEEGVVDEKEVRNATTQVATDKGVKTSQMYPKLDSIAREAGIYLEMWGWGAYTR